jgi:tRNA-splicing ligase RtcB (3'-phosphate/5'-hydroxy nucleic acid ligase)
LTIPVRIFGTHDQRTVEQLQRCANSGPATRAVLCADGHLGYSQPIGGAIAYEGAISPSGVGYDIGCGNKAVRTGIRADDLDVPGVMNEIYQRISFGMGRKNNEPVDHPVFDQIRTADFAPQREMLDLAVSQLGTVGAGNHYVDLFADEDAYVWIGVHFGSRGFGHKTASGFLALAQGLEWGDRAKQGEMDAPPTLFATDSYLGQAYISAMELAGAYAYAGRDVVVSKVLDILGASSVDEVHNHHNYAWLEAHDGREVWVVRKGCTPAFPGQRGFVGASMGERSVILEGVDSEASAEALYSTVHGAGRAMSRNQAAGKWRKREVCTVCGRQTCSHDAPRGKVRVREGGLVDFESVQGDLLSSGIELRGGAADEAPAAYKRLNEVLAEQGPTIQVTSTLRPIGVAMAAPDTFDPFKD